MKLCKIFTFKMLIKEEKGKPNSYHSLGGIYFNKTEQKLFHSQHIS